MIVCPWVFLSCKYVTGRLCDQKCLSDMHVCVYARVCVYECKHLCVCVYYVCV